MYAVGSKSSLSILSPTCCICSLPAAPVPYLLHLFLTCSTCFLLAASVLYMFNLFPTCCICSLMVHLFPT